MKNHETHISTKQAPSQKNYRLPRQNENCRWQKGDQPPPPSGKKEARRLMFSKAMRLQKRGEFQKVTKQGKRLVGRFLCLDLLPSKRSRLGISASGRYGSAPERNRFKRLVREVFRRSYAMLPAADLHVIPRQSAKNANCSDIWNDISRLLSQ